jgi:diguanylate cyclase (GGDEF)-like protein
VDELAVVGVLAALGAALVMLLGLGGHTLAQPATALVTGCVALLCGVVLAVRGTRPPLAARFRRLIGCAMALWGLCQLLLALAPGRIEPSFPTAADVVSFAAAPLAVAGALAIPCRRPRPQPLIRLGLDSALLAVTVAFLGWRLWFSAEFVDQPLTLAAASAAAVLLADVLVVCLGFLAWLRELDRDLATVAAGAACYGVAELVALNAALTPDASWPWQAGVLWCLAWPLLAAGLLRYRTEQAADDATGDPDARVVTVTTALAIGLLLAGLLTMIPRHSDVASLYFVALAVLVFGARELLNARQRSWLVTTLTTEAATDPLTGLCTLRLLTWHIGAVPAGETWCLLRVDLDGFQEVNDTFGHEVGDQLLRGVAQLLRDDARPGAVVSRIGGDEFCLLVRGGVEEGTVLAHHVVELVRSACAEADGHRVGVTASVGVASVRRTCPTGGSDRLEPLSAAGAALQRAKAHGREQVAVCGTELARERCRRLDLEDRLRRTIATGGLSVAFQPVLDLREGVVVGAEALARWRDPALGDVGPAEFIPVAEQAGLVVELGEHVLNTTLAAAARAGFAARGLRVSVNVSPLQLRVPGFADVVLDALARHGIPPELAVVEVTESVVVDQTGPAMACLRTLAGHGVTIAIDDFGSGYSALSYLSRLPAGVLKVDRSLTPSLTTSARAQAVVRAIVGLGQSLGLSVVLEGVESAELAELACSLGVGYAQGTWFGTPTGACDVVRLAEAADLRRCGRPVSVAASTEPELHQPVVEA